MIEMLHRYTASLLFSLGDMMMMVVRYEDAKGWEIEDSGHRRVINVLRTGMLGEIER